MVSTHVTAFFGNLTYAQKLEPFEILARHLVCSASQQMLWRRIHISQKQAAAFRRPPA